MNDSPIETPALFRMYDDSVMAGEVATLENIAGDSILDCMSMGCPLLPNVHMLTVAAADTASMLFVRPPT